VTIITNMGPKPLNVSGNLYGHPKFDHIVQAYDAFSSINDSIYECSFSRIRCGASSDFSAGK
jgi:hypothetical protein